METRGDFKKSWMSASKSTTVAGRLHRRNSTNCKRLREQIKGLEGKIGGELEKKFTAEDNRLQTTQNGLDTSEDKDISKMIQKAKAGLFVIQPYNVM